MGGNTKRGSDGSGKKRKGRPRDVVRDGAGGELLGEELGDGDEGDPAEEGPQRAADEGRESPAPEDQGKKAGEDRTASEIEEARVERDGAGGLTDPLELIRDGVQFEEEYVDEAEEELAKLEKDLDIQPGTFDSREIVPGKRDVPEKDEFEQARSIIRQRREVVTDPAVVGPAMEKLSEAEKSFREAFAKLRGAQDEAVEAGAMVDQARMDTIRARSSLAVNRKDKCEQLQRLLEDKGVVAEKMAEMLIERGASGSWPQLTALVRTRSPKEHGAIKTVAAAIIRASEDELILKDYSSYGNMRFVGAAAEKGIDDDLESLKRRTIVDALNNAEKLVRAIRSRLGLPARIRG